jgi:hypothetical protein
MAEAARVLSQMKVQCDPRVICSVYAVTTHVQTARRSLAFGE